MYGQVPSLPTTLTLNSLTLIMARQAVEYAGFCHRVDVANAPIAAVSTR